MYRRRSRCWYDILNEDNRKPDLVLAGRIVYWMKNEQNIIVGLVGDLWLLNVVPVTQPICFDVQNAGHLVTAFEKVLRDPELVFEICHLFCIGNCLRRRCFSISASLAKLALVHHSGRSDYVWFHRLSSSSFVYRVLFCYQLS